MMTTQVKCDVLGKLQSVEPSELQAIDGGLGYLGSYTPLGDRRDVGCGTMILIDRILKGMFPSRP